MSDLSRTMTLVRNGVGNRLEDVLRDVGAGLSGVDGAPDLLDAGSRLLAGGKRMRAVLAALGLALAAETDAEREQVLAGPTAAGLGAALELYQASALVHDDVIDAAETRRGGPAAHRRLAALHAGRGWRGSAAEFGVAGAILLGDLLLSESSRELGAAVERSGAPAAAGAAARAGFDAMTAEVAVGQFLDLRGEALPLPGAKEDPVPAARAVRAQALEVVRRKSAGYSVTHPLLLGAVLAGVVVRSPAHEALERFGTEVGIAFQLRDDALGVVGDPALTGKPVGDDLREGKRTVLLSLVWEHTDAEGRSLLREVLAHRGASQGLVDEAVALVRGSGALEEQDRIIAAHLRRASGAIADLERLGGDAVAGRAVSRTSLIELAAAARALTARSA